MSFLPKSAGHLCVSEDAIQWSALRCVPCSTTDLVSEESARPTAPAAFYTVPAHLNVAELIRSSESTESAWPARWKPHRPQGHDGGRDALA
jgi:hypothetical protein